MIQTTFKWMISGNVVWSSFLTPGMGKPKLGELGGFVPRPVMPALHGGWWASGGLNMQILGRQGQQRARGSWCGDGHSGVGPTRAQRVGKELGATAKLPLWFSPHGLKPRAYLHRLPCRMGFLSSGPRSMRNACSGQAHGGGRAALPRLLSSKTEIAGLLLLCSRPGIMELKLAPSSHVQVFDLKGKCFILGQMHPPSFPLPGKRTKQFKSENRGNSMRTVHRDPAPNWIRRNLIEVQLNPSAFVQMSFK